uniref:Glycosyltransferase n=1 Tax=Oryza barthii TaxID=65489 RepID=A0A0D3HBZ3_9ORYZ
MASPVVSRHVVAVPFPGRGHINPMLAVCRHLAAADAALAVTVVVTEEWHALLQSAGVPAALPDRVGFATIPNVIPSEHDRGADHIGFIVAVHTRMAAAVERLLDRLLLEWKRRPDAALYHFNLWPPVDGSESEQELSCRSLEQYVPGLSSVRLSDIKTFRASWERPMKIAEEALVNILYPLHLLPRARTGNHQQNSRNGSMPHITIYPIGPSIPHLPRNGDDPGKIGNDDHRSWLDARQENSVLYVSFGSYVTMSHSQLEEIAMALRDSGVQLFWVGRDKADSLQQQVGGDNGLVVPWSEGLFHPSIGGFLSLCGWNSVLEAVSAGVPLLAFPIGWDQLADGHIVADEWKIGINLRGQRGEDGIVSRAAIRAAVIKLMDLDDSESQEMRRRAAKLHAASRGAIQEGGSSHRSLNSLVNDLAQG